MRVAGNALLDGISGYGGAQEVLRPVRSTVESETTFCAESVALVGFAVHSVVMSSSGAGQYYWCLKHSRVESDANLCPSVERLGPYGTEAEAARALDRVAERNAAWDAEDERWNGERP